MTPISVRGNNRRSREAGTAGARPDAGQDRSTRGSASRAVEPWSIAGRRRMVGFTLLEVLVVLVIAGLLVSLASLSLSGNPRSDLIEQGQRLALLFETASDEAQLRDAPIEWQPVAGGYRFAVGVRGRWQPLGDELLAPARWKAGISGVSIRYPEANGASHTAGAMRFGTESIGPPVTVTLYSDVGNVVVATDGNGRFSVDLGATP